MKGQFVGLAVVGFLCPITRAVNFPWESIQLSNSDISALPALKFGNPSHPYRHTSECRLFPGDESWPNETEWNTLKTILNDTLLKPLPAGAPCYQGPVYNVDKCAAITKATFNRAALEDPLAIITQWAEGETCLPSLNATGVCDQGGFPVYVVNVSTVRDIQAGVNFARNKNLRLVIKNTGHDFGGRSVGAGSLSIWTHFLKDFEFIPKYSIGEYSGMAVKIGAGIETWEVFNGMAANNITVVAPGGGSVGVGGGWMAGGGHGALTSVYGLGSDQVLSIQVVTADGKFVTADPFTNEDLFYALRGGGGATYGIVTSMIMKAYPPISLTGSSLNFQGSGTPVANSTAVIYNTTTFFKGVNIYYRFAKKVVDAGGLGFTYVTPMPNGRYTFTASNSLPGLNVTQVINLMQPLYDELNRVGINLTNPKNLVTSPYARRSTGAAADDFNVRYRSRFIPRRNWEDDLWNQTWAAIQASIEAGYRFHGTLNGPTKKVAGWPGIHSGLNPAWRDSVMHAMLIGFQPLGLTAPQEVEEEAKIQESMDPWRELTPGSGSYLNEGDPSEDNWQQSFFGNIYPQLLAIKRKRDPWGLFWAQTSVGSEGWEVVTSTGYPNSQNGRLCRV